MNVAVLGLGHMGRAISNRLLDRGYNVTVWNRTAGRGPELLKKGAVEASSPTEAVRQAEIVFTLLTADAAIREVCLGPGGVIKNLSDNAVLVDMSTVHPDTSRALAQATPGGRFVDSPILGGPEVTAQGEAKLLVAGRQEVVERLSLLWQDLSSSHIYCGANGNATTLKLMSNLILVGGTALLGEAIVAGQASGIDDQILRQVFGQSPAVAPGVKVRLEDLLSGDHTGWWTIELAEKDVSLALRLASNAAVELPLAKASLEILERTDQSGYGQSDLGAVVELFRAPPNGDNLKR